MAELQSLTIGGKLSVASDIYTNSLQINNKTITNVDTETVSGDSSSLVTGAAIINYINEKITVSDGVLTIRLD